jgi:hypothetical protein
MLNYLSQWNRCQYALHSKSNGIRSLPPSTSLDGLAHPKSKVQVVLGSSPWPWPWIVIVVSDFRLKFGDDLVNLRLLSASIDLRSKASLQAS